MKAIKKPNVIIVEEFILDKKWPINVRPQPDGPGYEVYCKLHNSWIKIKPSDMINVTNPDDTYPIDRKVFDETYDIVEENIGD